MKIGEKARVRRNARDLRMLGARKEIRSLNQHHLPRNQGGFPFPHSLYFGLMVQLLRIGVWFNNVESCCMHRNI